MTTFTGYRGGSMQDAGFSGVSSNLQDDTVPVTDDVYLDDVVGESGSLTDNLPISMITQTFDGDRGFAGSGNDFWYYRFHIIPASLDAGNILNDTSIAFTVWNGWLTSKILADVVPEGDTEGLTISPPSPNVVPYTIAGLEEETFTLDVLVNGPSIIDVTYSFEFSSGEIIDLPVSGQRIFAWSFRPDWSGGVEERMEWVTDVLTAYDGSEQRIAIRANPRRTMAYDFAIDNNRDRMKFESLLFNWGARNWMIPVWMEGQALGADLDAGETSFTIDRVSADWQDGGYAIVMTDTFDYEILRISTISAGIVNLSSIVANNWPAGTVVYPAVTGLLGDKQGLSRFTGETMYGRCTFSLYETQTVPADSPTTYRGLPVITQVPHWEQDITADYVRKLRTIDFRVGKFAVDDEAGMPFQIVSHHWVCDGKSEIDSLRAFIYARNGKQKAVWLPTFAPDLEMVNSLSGLSVQLDVSHLFYVRHLYGHKNRRDIRIELDNGSVYYRRVTHAVEISSSVERLTIDSALGVTITPAEVRRISWMSVARLDTDSLSFQWRHDDWVECSVNWRTVRDDV